MRFLFWPEGGSRNFNLFHFVILKCIVFCFPSVLLLGLILYPTIPYKVTLYGTPQWYLPLLCTRHSHSLGAMTLDWHWPCASMCGVHLVGIHNTHTWIDVCPRLIFVAVEESEENRASRKERLDAKRLGRSSHYTSRESRLKRPSDQSVQICMN